MRTNFDHLPSRKKTNCTKWDDLQKRFGCLSDADVLPMWVADMDFPTPPEIVEELTKRISHGVYGYTMVSDSFSTTVSNWMKTRHSAIVDPSWVKFSPGVVPGIANAIQAFSNEGDGVIIQPPVYYPFFSVVEDNQRKLVFNPLIETDRSYRIDFDDLRIKASRPDVKLMILCNPHNPVGRVFTREELMEIGEICLANEVKLIVDEIHADIVFTPHVHVSFLTLPEDIRNNSIVLISPSKTFNLAGFQTSAVMIPDTELRAKYQRRSEITRTTSIGCCGETALEAAYNRCAYYADELVEYLAENKRYCEEQLAVRFPELTLFDLEGTYLLWIDFRRAKIELDDLDRFMIEDVKVAVDYGHWFGEEGRGFIRLNIACPKALLVEAFDRLDKAMHKSTT
ncbi:MAG: MalY/PatB family protein [Erysipelotrichaceae bacterium]